MYKMMAVVNRKILYFHIIIVMLARTPEIGQGLGRILRCGARKPEQTY